MPPPLSERRKPGLSETLAGPKAPTRCQSCGEQNCKEAPLSRWLEHDENDSVPDRPRVVVLCERCSRKLIEPHPRLYRLLDPGEAFPGCLGICVRCELREGNICAHPRAWAKDESRLHFTWDSEPIRAFLCGGRGMRSGLHVIYPSPVRECSGRVLKPGSHSDDPSHANDPPARQPSLDL